MPRCRQTTTRGTRCKRDAAAGGTRCPQHARGHDPRIPLLNVDLGERLVAMLRGGVTVKVATEAVGINRATFGDWMRRGLRGRPADAPYREFRARVEQARATAEVRHVTQVATAAGEDWRAATWMIERQLRQLEDETEPIDTAQLAADAEAAARAEAQATLEAIGEPLELSTGAVDRYALAVAGWRTLEAQWAQLGRPATTLGGATGTAQVPHPLIAQIAVARREAALLGGMLGLDPRGRHVLSRRVGAGRPPGAASAPDRVAAAPPRRQLRAVE